eukprot:5961346-Prorocentrum_lima.AAC.1
MDANCPVPPDSGIFDLMRPYSQPKTLSDIGEWTGHQLDRLICGPGFFDGHDNTTQAVVQYTPDKPQ